MFDRYQIQSTPSDMRVSVTEKRAPTDESVRLLREMEAAAEKWVLDSIRVANQEFECVIHIREDNLNDQNELAAVFRLNGKRMTARYFANRDETKEGVATGLRDAVAREIANQIAPAFADIFRRKL